MARPKGNQSDARERLLTAAGRAFRVGGFGGIGVDALAREAGFTSGAFYAHFDSKSDAFRFAVVDGLEFLLEGVEAHRRQHGADWIGPFVDFYFGERLDGPLAEACALPTLTTDAARADVRTRDAYQGVLERLVAVVADGMGGTNRRARALTLLALCSGGAAMARAVTDATLRGEIAAAASAAAKAI